MPTGRTAEPAAPQAPPRPGRVPARLGSGQRSAGVLTVLRPKRLRPHRPPAADLAGGQPLALRRRLRPSRRPASASTGRGPHRPRAPCGGDCVRVAGSTFASAAPGCRFAGRRRGEGLWRRWASKGSVDRQDRYRDGCARPRHPRSCTPSRRLSGRLERPCVCVAQTPSQVPTMTRTCWGPGPDPTDPPVRELELGMPPGRGMELDVGGRLADATRGVGPGGGGLLPGPAGPGLYGPSPSQAAAAAAAADSVRRRTPSRKPAWRH